MATLVLQTVGSFVGSFFGPIGSAIGSALGGLAGTAIDQTLLSSTTKRSGPRLDTLQVMASTEGAPIPRLYGSARLAGQIIWATALEEIASTRKVGTKGARQKVTEYAYRANVAIGLCEGPISHVRRVWADGRPLDLKGVVMRVHGGGEEQEPDPLIVAKEGAANAPAYRGLAYVVFEHLPLEDYGNRIPQLQFEVVKPVGGLESKLRAVALIPGAGEFVYDDGIVTALPRPGLTARVNRHMPSESSDFTASLDELEALCPALERVALVVSWFGDDLRAGHCRIEPRVETNQKTTMPRVWTVAGLARAVARPVSTGPQGSPAYGGTPSDDSVVRAVQALKARGLAVTLYPFVMMDVPAGNALPNPMTGTAGQPPYPWRGRITVDPAPGLPGSPDGSAAAAAQIAAFFGSVDDWSYRRMILHLASLANAAGGVEAFVLGSEFVGLTRVRSAPGVYPAVAELVTLAGELRQTLGPGTRIVYGADWTEYGARVIAGRSEVRFPLDPLFASSFIDAVAVDWYAPLSDWRDGEGHRDAYEARSIYDRDYLKANVAGGEGFDWWYASEADRAAQIRSPIEDGAYGKPWIFRQKDLAGWWSNPHVERVGGLELAHSTAWVPRSKPIWLLEAGCPAVNKGSNQPSAFPDPKSSENTLPRYSDGSPDALIQSRAAEALIAHWAEPAANPLSPSYGRPMVDPSRIYFWAWDARPFPAFPDAAEVWSDSGNWALGHWLTGRLGMPTLDRLLATLLADYGVMEQDASALEAVLAGAVIDRPMSARDAIEPLATLFCFQGFDRAGCLTFRHTGAGPALPIGRDDLVDDGKSALVTRLRAQETELPRTVRLAFADPTHDYAPASEASRRLDSASRGELSLNAALILEREEARRRAEIVLQDLWVARETASFALPRSRQALEPGDLVRLDTDGRARLFMLTRIADKGRLAVEARRVEPGVFARAAAVRVPGGFEPAPPDPLPQALLLDLPVLREGEAVLQWIAASADPWPGAVNLWRSSGGGSFALFGSAGKPANMGRLAAPLPPGPAGRWDHAGELLVALDGAGNFESRTEAEVLDGANALALRRADGSFEVLQFATATPVSESVLRLSGLLRGQLGTDGSSETIGMGAELVLLDEALVPAVTRFEEIGRALLWRVGPAGVDAGDDAVVELAGAATNAALRPYAPARVSARREAQGVTISWIRRTRLGGDGWEAGEVPLGEDHEAYEVDIMAGALVRRTLASTTTSLFYSAADEIADFGTPQQSLIVRVHQLSALTGRGTMKEVTLNV
jgi:hypothetical protein